MNQELALALVRQSPDAVIFADIEGAIRVWNDAAVRIFGYTAEQAIGEMLDIVIPERFREAHWKGFERAVNDRATKYAGQSLATRSVRSDGAQIYVEMSFAVVLDSDDEVLGVVSLARDITERFEKDRADRKRMQELEEALAEGR